MTLRLMEIFVAEGTEQELAMYTTILLDMLKKISDFEKKKEVEDWMKKFGDKTFEELMQAETKEDDKSE